MWKGTEGLQLMYDKTHEACKAKTLARHKTVTSIRLPATLPAVCTTLHANRS